MTLILTIVGLVVVPVCWSMPGPSDDPLGRFVCKASTSPYIVPDPKQCDRFAICTEQQKKAIRLCKDGFALDLSKGHCDLLAKVDCRQRSELQPTTSTNKFCPRANGFFEIPDVCTEYVDCRESVDYARRCAPGTVFDGRAAGCVHVDQAQREDCKAEHVLNFKCPENNDDDVAGRSTFTHGNHNRFADPEDCSKYFICRENNQPRQFSCKVPTVFDAAAGVCKHYKEVDGCQNHYETADLGNNLKVVLVTDI